MYGSAHKSVSMATLGPAVFRSFIPEPSTKKKKLLTARVGYPYAIVVFFCLQSEVGAQVNIKIAKVSLRFI